MANFLWTPDAPLLFDPDSIFANFAYSVGDTFTPTPSAQGSIELVGGGQIVLSGVGLAKDQLNQFVPWVFLGTVTAVDFQAPDGTSRAQISALALPLSAFLANQEFPNPIADGPPTYSVQYLNAIDAVLAGDDVVSGGGDVANILHGKGSNDLISGLGGDDIADGGTGDDTAIFLAGPRSEFDVRTVAVSGVLQTIVAHQGGAQAEGTDTLTNTEMLQFADHTFNLARGQLNHLSSVDGDRFDDVLFQNATTGQVYFARMVDGTFQTWGVDTAALGPDWKAVASGDVNPGLTGGAETFVQQQSTGTIYYASLDTGATTWGLVDAAPGPDWKLRVVADMNGDAAADAVLQNMVTGAIKYAAMFNGTFQGYDTVNQSLTADWLLVGAGDINRDGLADAVIQQQSTGTTYYAAMADGTFQSWGVVSQNITADWDVKAVADVTGDGFADVIFQNLAGGGVAPGTTYFADMANGGFTRWGVVTANVTGSWVAQGTADVDNDGFADVLFQNAANGTAYYANMGPAGFESWGAVASNIGADWQVV